ncbi:MAG: hypothetical protein QXI58_08530 [Candidatus Micrarchaeia archaeon]
MNLFGTQIYKEKNKHKIKEIAYDEAGNKCKSEEITLKIAGTLI